MSNQRKPKQDPLVVRKISAGTWSVQKKAVPGFRLSKSTTETSRGAAPGRPTRPAAG